MEASTTIYDMMSTSRIIVPDYQRAYSWDISQDHYTAKKPVDTFLADLEDYLQSNVSTPYYFGHFLFEQLAKNEYAIIDGQQRLTTITIFLSVLFSSIRNVKALTEDEEVIYENMIKRRSQYKFSTVQYDNQLFRDYVIDHIKTDHYGIETTSGQRIVEAYDYFVNKVNLMPLQKCEALLNAVVNAACTTHIVNGEAEAIQMFIFQNNRGKKPSHLEVIKAQFMYHIHIYGGDETDSLLQEIKWRFEHIYHSISSIENFVNEDNVLNYTLKVYFNSLWESEPLVKVNEELAKDSQLEFIRNFTLSLERSFNNLVRLNDDHKRDVNVEASLLCGRYDILYSHFI